MLAFADQFAPLHLNKLASFKALVGLAACGPMTWVCHQFQTFSKLRNFRHVVLSELDKFSAGRPISAPGPNRQTHSKGRAPSRQKQTQLGTCWPCYCLCHLKSAAKELWTCRLTKSWRWWATCFLMKLALQRFALESSSSRCCTWSWHKRGHPLAWSLKYMKYPANTCKY